MNPVPARLWRVVFFQMNLATHDCYLHYFSFASKPQIAPHLQSRLAIGGISKIENLCGLGPGGGVSKAKLRAILSWATNGAIFPLDSPRTAIHSAVISHSGDRQHADPTHLSKELAVAIAAVEGQSGWLSLLKLVGQPPCLSHGNFNRFVIGLDSLSVQSWRPTRSATINKSEEGIRQADDETLAADFAFGCMTKHPFLESRRLHSASGHHVESKV